MRIEASGSLTVNGTLTYNGTLLNEGDLSAVRLVLGDSAGHLTNSGTLSADNLYLNSDSSFNSGSITVFDTVAVGPLKHFMNSGSCTGSFCWSSFTINTGELVFERFGADGDVSNSGLLRASISMIVFDTLHSLLGAYLDVDTLIINRLVVNNGFMNIRRWFRVPGYGAFDAGQTGQAFCNGNFSNSGLVKGNGDLCISGFSYNTGDIQGSPDICDLTLTATSPPYLDYNAGIVGPNVNWCPSANCTTMDVPDIDRAQPLTLAPNPATDQITLTDLPGTGPWSIQLFDMEGRAHAIRTEAKGEGMILLRGDLAAGCYTLVISTDEADRRSVARVVLVDR
jgi:hypothetical protein